MQVRELVTKDRVELGVGDWVTISQEQVDGFADVTCDHQWIHVDVDRAREGPFGTTIAHGYLLLSLVPVLVEQILTVDDRTMGVNYGADRVRFTGPVPVGSRVRARLALLRGERRPDDGVLTVFEFVLEREGRERPAMVAELLTLHHDQEPTEGRT